MINSLVRNIPSLKTLCAVAVAAFAVSQATIVHAAPPTAEVIQLVWL